MSPLCGSCGPCNFRSSGQCVRPVARLITAHPSESLLFYSCRFGIGAEILRISFAVRLSECMSAGYERNGLFVIHCHAPECFADVFRRKERVGIAVRAFGIDIDQTHLNSRKRIFKISFAGVSVSIVEPFLLRAPVYADIGLPYIFSSSRKTEGLESHRLKRNISGQYKEVCPGYLVSVFLLDRPQQSSRFIEVCIVRPAVKRCKSLKAFRAPASAVTYPVSSGCVP